MSSSGKNRKIKSNTRPKTQVTRIDFIINPNSQHGVLAHFTTKLQSSLRKMGILSSSYNILSQPLTEICARLAKNRPDCTIGFNVVLPEALFYEPLGIPHVALIVDSATYYPELLRCPNTLASFAETDSISFLQSLKKEHLFFFPHAIESSLAAKKNIDRKLEFEVFMPASYIDADAPFSILKEHFPKTAVTAFDNIIESCLASPETSHLSCLKELFDTHKEFQQTAIDKRISFFDLFSMVELTMRGRDKINLLKAINHAEVTISCSLDDQKLWKKAVGRKKNVRFHDPIAYKELYPVLAKSCCVINSIPTIKRGFHERLFLAASAGAATVTNASCYQEKYFPENKAIITYLSPRYSLVNKKIEDIINHPEKRKKDINLVKKIILADHTWDVRAKFLVDELCSRLAKVPLSENNLLLE